MKSFEPCGEPIGLTLCGEYCKVVEDIVYCAECFGKRQKLGLEKIESWKKN